MTDSSSFLRTIHAVDAIEKTIDDAAYGWRNESAVREIQAQCFAIKYERSDPYIREKVGLIESDADILYSPRKADKHGGSENVKSQLYRHCQSIRTRVRTLEKEATTTTVGESNEGRPII